MYASLKALLLKAANAEYTSKEVDELASKYSGDVNVNCLVAQLSTFHVLTKGVRLRCFKDILTNFKGLKPKARQLSTTPSLSVRQYTSTMRQVRRESGSSRQQDVLKRGRSIKNAASKFKPSCNFEHTQKEIRQAMFRVCG